ncbi:patatin-like phospholipase family protein [Hoeflea sp.]|uniref:patatin-like phospholipase family protein n=1 Tax=Hoeflea sp. TaxID=1940281 RepID=UPI0025C6E926|nr:patatin-like phospholipase family protein [Hoeflea sp.]
MSGGNALGADHLGACEVLLGAGWEPEWLVGASIGAVTAAILAGSKPSDRLDRLKSFWKLAEQADVAPMFTIPEPFRARYNNEHALAALIFGRPGLFGRRLPGELSLLPGMPSDRSIMDHRPMARTLDALIDFDRLNHGDTRVSFVTIDLEAGEEVWFDNRETRFTSEHLLACTALAPLFPPVEIEGRLLCDAGLANNLPFDRVFRDTPTANQLCIAVDLFSASHVRPDSLDQTVAHVQDLAVAMQARRSANGVSRARDLLRKHDPDSPSSILAHLAYRPPGTQRALKALDFSARSLGERTQQEAEDMGRMLQRNREAPRDQPFCYLGAE